MISLLRRYEVWVFFFTAVSANAIFVWSISEDLMPQRLYGYGRFLLLGGILIAIVLIARGRAGTLELIRPLAKWRVDLRWYIFGLLWGATTAFTVLLIMASLGGRGIAFDSIGLGPLRRPGVVMILVVGSLIGEVVWIGYALVRLAPRLGYFFASQVVGVVWAFWWFPIVLLNIGVIPDLPLGALLVNQSGVAAICALLYARTGSGLVVLLAQISFNSAIIIFPVNPTAGGVTTYWVFAIFYWFTALALHLLLARPSDLWTNEE